MEKNTKTGKEGEKQFRKYRFITQEESRTLKRLIGVNYYREFEKNFKKEHKGITVPGRAMVSNVLNGWANNQLIMKTLIEMAKKGEALEQELKRMSGHSQQTN